MTYPSDFTNPSDVFGELVNLAVLPVTGITDTGTEWRFAVTFSADVPDVNPNTPLVYTHPAADGDYEIVTVVSCERASGYVVVERAQEGTVQLAYGDEGYLVQEPTAGTYTALKNLLLVTQKYIGRVGAALPDTCSPGMFYLLTTGEFYACFSTNVWTQLDQVDHGALTGLTDEDAHTIYRSLTQAIVWHDAMEKQHLTSAATHDHSDSFAGAGKPVRKLRSGDFVERGAVKNSGDVFVASDTRTFYISTDGINWKSYSTVPRGTVLMFETACPGGWDRVTTMDDRFPRGAPSDVWVGFGSGGSATHQHDLTTLIAHTHTVAGAVVSTTSGGSHSHSLSIYGGSGGSSVPFDDSPASGSINSSSSGNHSHTVTIPQVTTGSYGVASPKTAAVDSNPAYQKLVFCRKA